MSQIFQRDMPLNEADPNNLLMHINRHLERIAGLSSLTINDLKQAIMSDPVLFNALKGVSGDTIQNYGGSLLKNGSLELGTLEGWESNYFDIVDNAIVTREYFVGHTQKIKFRNDRLYKIDAIIDVQGVENSYVRLTLKGYSSQNVVTADNYGKIASLGTNQRFIEYFGGTSAQGGQTIFKDNSEYFRFIVLCYSGAILKIKKLVVSELSLGEPVPFNLPYLPVGQMVFDPTDGSVGRYDGITIHWFTIA